MFGISPVQLLIILAIVILIFGTKKLRNIGGDVGSAIKHFKSAMKESDEEVKNQLAKSVKNNDNVIENEIQKVSEKKDI